MRGPLIVDTCLRIGYTTILLGTLGYFGLGLAPESPDWGTSIKDASRLLRTSPSGAAASLRADEFCWG
jgi:peptide/nickel transport system permease protein